MSLPDRNKVPHDEETLVLLALSLIPGMGSRRIHQFLALLTGRGYEIATLSGVTPALFYRQFPEMVDRFQGVLESLVRDKLEEARETMRHATRLGLELTHVLDSGYPRQLREFLDNNAPPVLFFCGPRTLFEQDGCAVVGTRSPSPAGIRAARQASEKIVGACMALVSGGAVGVDWAAHDAAVCAGAGNRTVPLAGQVESSPGGGTDFAGE